MELLFGGWSSRLRRCFIAYFFECRHHTTAFPYCSGMCGIICREHCIWFFLFRNAEEKMKGLTFISLLWNTNSNVYTQIAVTVMLHRRCRDTEVRRCGDAIPLYHFVALCRHCTRTVLIAIRIFYKKMNFQPLYTTSMVRAVSDKSYWFYCSRWWSMQ